MGFHVTTDVAAPMMGKIYDRLRKSAFLFLLRLDRNNFVVIFEPLKIVKTYYISINHVAAL